MTKYFYVSTLPVKVRAVNSRPCATLDDALRGARFMLGNGAAEVSIVDSNGSVVLPGDEVRMYSDVATLSSRELAFS